LAALFWTRPSGREFTVIQKLFTTGRQQTKLSICGGSGYFGRVRTADFHFDLPPELIAQQPASRRDASRLLVVRRAERQWEHCHFKDLPGFLKAGDVLVLNNSRVIPARLHGINPRTGGKFEILLLEENEPNDWWAMMRPGKRGRVGTRIALVDKTGGLTGLVAEVAGFNDEGHRRLRFSGTDNLHRELETLGETPLPPYIERHGEQPGDRERYQTVYAETAGSVAAPTAGLHFTADLLAEIRAKGVQVCFVTLHVGAGTFLPVKVDNPNNHQMHSERFVIGPETVAAVNAAKAEGRRVIAVGTTATRALESVARKNEGKLNVYAGKTNLFVFPPATFQIVDALLTNFHLPESTLLMLVSAFATPGEPAAGRDLILSAYAEAVRERYRFFSYGDAMLLL
jgi:S-adenosylmethionine:tRNA ribosyltransferase-isomerase